MVYSFTRWTKSVFMRKRCPMGLKIAVALGQKHISSTCCQFRLASKYGSPKFCSVAEWKLKINRSSLGAQTKAVASRSGTVHLWRAIPFLTQRQFPLEINVSEKCKGAWLSEARFRKCQMGWQIVKIKFARIFVIQCTQWVPATKAKTCPTRSHSYSLPFVGGSIIEWQIP